MWHLENVKQKYVLTFDTSAGFEIWLIRLLASNGGLNCGLAVVGGAGVVTGNNDPNCNYYRKQTLFNLTVK